MMPLKTQKQRNNLVKMLWEELKRGITPWHKPWKIHIGHRIDAITGRPRSKMNAINLMMKACVYDYDDPRWCTFKPVQENGWMIKVVTEGTHIEFWKFEEDLY